MEIHSQFQAMQMKNNEQKCDLCFLRLLMLIASSFSKQRLKYLDIIIKVVDKNDNVFLRRLSTKGFA